MAYYRIASLYIEKFSQTSLVTDPFGNTTEVNSIAYFVCKFNWVFGSSLLTLIEPPRSIKKFVNALHDLTGLGLVVSEATVNIGSWLSRIEDATQLMTITKINTSGITSSDYSTARLSIVGSKDVRGPINEMLKDRDYIIDGASFFATSDGLDFRCEISKTGSMKIASINAERTLALLRESLECTLLD